MRRNGVRKWSALLTLMVLGLSGLGKAHADPINDLVSLLMPVEKVTASGVGPTAIFISWEDRSIVEGGFLIQMALEDEAGQYTTVATTPPCQNGVSPSTTGTLGAATTCRTSVQASQMNLQAADPRTLFFRVVPFIELPNNIERPSPGQGVRLLEGQPSLADPAILGPLRPTNLLCNGGGPLACVNVTTVRLTWTDNSDETAFWVYRARGGTNPNFGTTPHKQLPPNTTMFEEQILNDFGAVYSYKVTAVRQREVPLLPDPRREELSLTETAYSDSGTTSTGSGSSSDDHVVVEIAPVPAPTDPRDLVGTFTAPSTVSLTWTDVANTNAPYVDEDGWFIEIGPGSDPDAFQSMWSAPPKVGQGTATWSDSSHLPDNGLRCYRVRGWRVGTAKGPAVSAYTPNPVCFGAIPKAPSSLKAVAPTSAAVVLTWKDNSNSEEVFTVERCVGTCSSSGTWVEIDNAVVANSTTFTDTGTLGNTTYSYRVFAKNSTGKSASSNIATVKTPPAPLPAPSGLTAESRARAIFLSWQDNATSETGYMIEYRSPGGDWGVLVQDLPVNTESHLDANNLAIGQERCYRVRAMKGSAVGDPSAERCQRTLTFPVPPNGVPSDVDAIVQSNTAILLSWTDNSTNESSFRIEYAVVGNQHCQSVAPATLRFQLLKNLTLPIDPAAPNGPRSFTATGLAPHSAYFFRLKAVNGDGETAWGAATFPLGTGSLATVTGCDEPTKRGTTFGPPLPEFKDPDRSGTLDSTRCTFTVSAPRGGHDTVGGLRVYVIAQVADTNIAHTDTLFVRPDTYSVPGERHDPTRSQYIVRHDASPNPPKFTYRNGATSADSDHWIIRYNFRRGVIYKLIATSFLQTSPYWASGNAIITDVKVAADCPTGGL